MWRRPPTGPQLRRIMKSDTTPDSGRVMQPPRQKALCLGREKTLPGVAASASERMADPRSTRWGYRPLAIAVSHELLERACSR